MKKLLFAAVSVLAVATAVAADSTQFGVLTVPSSAKETIVSVPWLESSTIDKAVSVSNLVLTSGLKVGDQLMYYNGSSYVSWVIAQDSSESPKYWTPGNIVKEVNDEQVVIATGASSDVTIPRGGSVILKRADPGNCFYIMGKPFTGTETAITIPGGSTTAPVYSLVAPPSVSAIDVNTGITWGGDIGEADMMIMTDGSSLLWGGSNDQNWYKRVNNVWTKDGITIPAGTGAWFISKSTGNKTFTINATNN